MQPIKVQIKPISANRAWRGRRFKSDDYYIYEETLAHLLPPIPDFPSPPFHIHFVFGLSNPRQDYDNCLKQTQDGIAKCYGFDDNLIYKATVEKDIVKKGYEYIQFSIEHYEAKSQSVLDHFKKTPKK